MDYRWLDFVRDIEFDFLHCKEEGRDVAQYADAAQALAKSTNTADAKVQQEAIALSALMNKAPLLSNYKYVEPDELGQIQVARPSLQASRTSYTAPKFALDTIDLYDHIYGAWLARCAGCLLGQPVEGWRRARITGLLQDTQNYPPKNYIASNIDPLLREKYGVKDEGRVYGSNHINWINNVSFMPEDDDTNYTVLALKTVESYGLDFTQENVAESWLMNLAMLHTCTAERVAYRNFANRILPPQSATYLNPYREWIGAQIRADFYGYIALAQPERAAEFAWRDASISHTKNGIYGAMWVAAMLAVAPFGDEPSIVEAGLAQLPQHSRLSEKIREVLAWYQECVTWETALERIHRQFDESYAHHWVHTISNAMIVAVAILWGELDMCKTLGIALSAAFDTDCNAATAGSIVGMARGAKALPTNWIAPLNDKIISGIDGFGLVKISELAQRTVKLTKQVIHL